MLAQAMASRQPAAPIKRNKRVRTFPARCSPSGWITTLLSPRNICGASALLVAKSVSRSARARASVTPGLRRPKTAHVDMLLS